MLTLLIITICLAIIIGGITLLVKSAKKFQLTDKQLQQIKEREKQQKQKDAE